MPQQATITNTPRNPILGLLADAIQPVANSGLLGEFLLGKSGKVLDDMSYGYSPTTGKGMTTGVKPDAVDLLNLTPLAGVAKPLAKIAGREIARQVQTGTGLVGRNVIDPRQNIVPVDVAKQFKMQTSLPQTEDFLSAVAGTKGAELTPEGLKLPLVRFQKPDQELSESVRSGVFYLPEGNPNTKYYRNAGTASNNNAYGGTDKIQGETLLRNPLFVKGATGGKAPEEAYKQLMGKQAFKEMQDDLMKAIRSRDKGSEAYMFLEKYAPEIADTAWNIAENSKQGNQFRYALQEAVFGNAARNAGYDSILGYSKGRGDKGNFFSEVFDLREQLYPSPSGEYGLMPQFEGLLD